ncbi:MAG: hypothetical protein P8P83_03095 [Rickettsiaceae bacterium]|nr:hypothetical protein [Rickettsiaceae bacterium]
MKTCENLQEFLNFSLEERAEITELRHNTYHILSKGARLLAEALKTNNTLTSLFIYNSQIGDEGAEALAEALKTNSTLTKLDLSYNNMGYEDAKAFAEALETNKTLTSLRIGMSDIGDKGAEALANALQINNTLTSLILPVTLIGTKGAALLAESLKTNTTLIALNLYGNNIGDKGAGLFAAALKENSTITLLNLDGGAIGFNLNIDLDKHIDLNKLIQYAVVEKLKQIAQGGGIEDIDIREIPNIKHTKFLTDHIINPLERYAENKAYFKQMLQQYDLGSYIETLDAKVTIHQDLVGFARATPLLKTKNIFIEDSEGSIVEIKYSNLQSYQALGKIGSYLTAEDARVLKEAFSAPEKDSDKALSEDSLMDRPLDGSGGGGITIAEMAEQAEEYETDARKITEDLKTNCTLTCINIMHNNTRATEEASEVIGDAVADH